MGVLSQFWRPESDTKVWPGVFPEDGPSYALGLQGPGCSSQSLPPSSVPSPECPFLSPIRTLPSDVGPHLGDLISTLILITPAKNLFPNMSQSEVLGGHEFGRHHSPRPALNGRTWAIHTCKFCSSRLAVPLGCAEGVVSLSWGPWVSAGRLRPWIQAPVLPLPGAQR